MTTKVIDFKTIQKPTETDINKAVYDALKTLKSYCMNCTDCKNCIMKKMCDEIPVNWEI